MKIFHERTYIWRLALASIALLPPLLSFSQQTPSSAKDHHSSGLGFTLTECEGVDNCATWHFVKNEGLGRWKNGEIANLRITELKQIDSTNWSISIHRVDLDGENEGYIADYHGTLRKNGTVGGEFKSDSNGGEGDWYAIPKGALPALVLPVVMHFCDVNCLSLKLIDGRYIATNNPAHNEAGWSETFVVKKFTRESVILERTLTGNPYHFKDVKYEGQISSDDNSIVNAKNPFCCSGNQPQYVSFVWGELLNSIPGDYTSPGPRQTSEITVDQALRGADIMERIFRDLLDARQ